MWLSWITRLFRWFCMARARPMAMPPRERKVFPMIHRPSQVLRCEVIGCGSSPAPPARPMPLPPSITEWVSTFPAYTWSWPGLSHRTALEKFVIFSAWITLWLEWITSPKALRCSAGGYTELFKVISGTPSPSVSPFSTTPPPARGGSWLWFHDPTSMTVPLRAGSKLIVTPSGVWLAASSASRSEMPSLPGEAASASGLEVSPLTSSLLFTTVSMSGRSRSTTKVKLLSWVISAEVSSG